MMTKTCKTITSSSRWGVSYTKWSLFFSLVFIMESCKCVTRSVMMVARAMECTMGLDFWVPMEYPP